VVVLTEDPGRAAALTGGVRVVLWPPAPGADLLLASGRPPVPLLWAGAVPATAAARGELARLLAATPAPAALDVPAGADLSEIAPRHTVLEPDPGVGWGVKARETGTGSRTAERRTRVVLVPPRTDRIAVDPAELARLLRDAGSTGRDAAAVLAALGVPRREAYRLASDIDQGSAARSR
jgi:hypothetical protein